MCLEISDLELEVAQYFLPESPVLELRHSYWIVNIELCIPAHIPMISPLNA